MINTPETELLKKGTDEDENAGTGGEINFIKKNETSEENAPQDDDDEFSQGEINDSLAEGITIGVQMLASFTVPRAVNAYRASTGVEGRVNTTVAAKAVTMDAKTEGRVKKLTQKVLDYYLTDTTHPLVALLIVIIFYLIMSFDKVNDIAENNRLKDEIKSKDAEIKELKKKIQESSKPKKEEKEQNENSEENENKEEKEEVILLKKPRGRPRKNKAG